MDEKIRSLIFQAIDETISADDFDRLQDAIEQSDEVRSEYLRAVNLCESLGEFAPSSPIEVEPTVLESRRAVKQAEGVTADLTLRRLSLGHLAIAASIMTLVGGFAFWFGRGNSPGPSATVAVEKESPDEGVEAQIAGHATLRRSVDLQWSGGTQSYREGDVLPNGLLRFDDGIAEIDFFCGATLIVEGPASLDLESDWSVRVLEGRLRANVPPAARGFIVKAAGAEIVDLGTEFALEVGSDNARVEVIDGEVELRGGAHDGDHLTTGQREWLKETLSRPEAFRGLSTGSDLQRRREAAEAERFGEWKDHSRELRNDDRLIAYYPIAESQVQRSVPNLASTGSDLDGTLVGPVDRTSGRFGGESVGLEFDRPGSRVRTRIDGEFTAFTFACWARIDRLENVYNALFLSDGYENGEPHWQIRDDGRLMFSVMVDDTQKVQIPNRFDQRMVQDAGRHRIYLTEPFWDISKSGQWFHISAVYDPVARRVEQYVNGEQISSEEIIDTFHIDTLRIGPAEIGNWGQPFRKTPWFSVRNLNGTIDELAIFNAGLTATEIRALYEQGKPLGY